MKITKRLVILITSVALALYTSGAFDELVLLAVTADLRNHVLSHYGLPFGLYCITSFHRIYLRFTIINVLVFTAKYLPTGLYLYNFLKDMRRSSREYRKSKEMEHEDIVLQIAIVKTKQCVREAECTECESQIERAAAQVRVTRVRVHELVAADQALRPLLEAYSPSRLANVIDHHATSEDLNLMEFLKDLAHDNSGIAERLTESGEGEPRDATSASEKSDNSARSESEVEKECQIKIIKVTNVYKVAYLKHYIKQKRLRRATRQSLLKTKMDNIKLLLENWQKSLNLVIKDRYMLEGRGRDEMSEEAGDSRLRDSDTDTAIDEYNPAWVHPGPYKNYYKEPDITQSQEDFECQEFDNYCGNFYEEIDTSVYEELDTKYECEAQCACARLPRLQEETSSQLLAAQDFSISDHHDSNEHI